MGDFVYKYVHPVEGCIYVGRTNDLYTRIKDHDRGINDNIAPEYTDLLKKSDVYYLEVANKAEAVWIEAYLINTTKPKLNKMLVYQGVTSSITVALPDFTKLDDIDRFKTKKNTNRTSIFVPKKQKSKRIRGFSGAILASDQVDLLQLYWLKLDVLGREILRKVFSLLVKNSHIDNDKCTISAYTIADILSVSHDKLLTEDDRFAFLNRIERVCNCPAVWYMIPTINYDAFTFCLESYVKFNRSSMRLTIGLNSMAIKFINEALIEYSLDALFPN